MSENELTRRLEEFTAEEKEIYSRPVSGPRPGFLVTVFGMVAAVAVAVASSYVDGPDAKVALMVVAGCLAAATAAVMLVDMFWSRSETKDRKGRLDDVATRRSKFLREQ